MPGIAQLRQFGKAAEDIMRKLLPPEPGMEDLAAAVGYVEYAGSPVGALTPEFVGQRCFDTTNNLWYRASGTTSTDWTDGGAAAVGVTSFTADDTGTAWRLAPQLMEFTATLASGTSTVVLLEVRTAAGVVSTLATITADVVSQVLRAAVLTREQKEFRFRRSSGTGSVTITY